MTNDLKVAGRVFRSVTPLTAWQIGYFAAHLRAAKAEALVAPSQAGHLESFDQLVESLLVSSHLYYLMAAALVEVTEGIVEQPDGSRRKSEIVQPWSNTRADEVAALFMGLTDQADIAAIRPAIWEVLAGFFPSGRTSSATSPSSSDQTGNPSGTGAHSTSTGGRGLHEPWPVTTGRKRRKSSAGRRGKSASPASTNS